MRDQAPPLSVTHTRQPQTRTHAHTRVLDTRTQLGLASPSHPQPLALASELPPPPPLHFCRSSSHSFPFPDLLKRGPPLRFLPFSPPHLHSQYEQSCRLLGLTAHRRCRLPPQTPPSLPSFLPLSSASSTSPTLSPTPTRAQRHRRRTCCESPSVLTQRTSVRRRLRTALAAKSESFASTRRPCAPATLVPSKPRMLATCSAAPRLSSTLSVSPASIASSSSSRVCCCECHGSLPATPSFSSSWQYDVVVLPGPWSRSLAPDI